MFSSFFGGSSASSSNAKKSAAQSVTSKIKDMLLDESLKEISRLEMNKIAFYMYHQTLQRSQSKSTGSSVIIIDNLSTTNNDKTSGIPDNTPDMCEAILELLEDILSNAMNPSSTFTVTAVQKTLVLVQHVLIFGPERVISSCLFLARHIQALQEYNTVLLAAAQRRQSSLTYLATTIKGGSVDYGEPVREEASKAYKLLTNREELEYQRSVQADPHALVPVGNENNTATDRNDNNYVFINDAARQDFLKRAMEKEQKMIEMSTSNLKKADASFGSGYNAANGKQVVGAAHSLDEMVKQVERQKQLQEKLQVRQTYQDGSSGTNASSQNAYGDDLLYGDYQAPSTNNNNYGYSASNNSISTAFVQQQEVDLLDFSSDQPLQPTGIFSQQQTQQQQQQQTMSSAYSTGILTIAPTIAHTLSNNNSDSGQDTDLLDVSFFQSDTQQQQFNSGGGDTWSNSIMGSGAILTSNVSQINYASPFDSIGQSSALPTYGSVPPSGLPPLPPSTVPNDLPPPIPSGLSPPVPSSAGVSSVDTDPFSVFDSLNVKPSNNTGMTHSNNSLSGTSNGNVDLALSGFGLDGLAISSQSSIIANPVAKYNAGSIRISNMMNDANASESSNHSTGDFDTDIVSGFVMGGTIGQGWASAPAAPPPPPP